MAAKTKTTYSGVPVADFIHSFVEQEHKRQDSLRLVELMEQWSGFEARMWGPSIIGFGNYHYKYASGHEGEAPMIGFSPRKAAFTLYAGAEGEAYKELLAQLGTYKISKACIYFKKLSDLNLDILEQVCKASIAYVQAHHQCSCRG